MSLERKIKTYENDLSKEYGTWLFEPGTLEEIKKDESILKGLKRLDLECIVIILIGY